MLESAEDWRQFLNPDSLRVDEGVLVEPSLAGAPTGATVQFERQGYYCVDESTSPERLVFHRTVTLRDSWGKAQKKG